MAPPRRQLPRLVGRDDFPASSGGTTEIETAWTDALDAWSDAGSVIFSYAYGGTTSQTASASNDDQRVAHYVASTTALATIAQAAVWAGGGQIFDCDITFYGQNGVGTWDYHVGTGDAPAGEHDFRYIATHELGHCLGLNHSASSAAVMHGSTNYGPLASDRDLDTDDIDGFQAIYGGYSTATLDLVDWFVSGSAGVGDTVSLTFSVDNLSTTPAIDAQVSVSSTSGEISVTQAVAYPSVDEDQAGSSTDRYGTVSIDVSALCTTVGDVPLTITLAAANATDVVVSDVLTLACVADDGGDSGYRRHRRPRADGRHGRPVAPPPYRWHRAPGGHGSHRRHRAGGHRHRQRCGRRQRRGRGRRQRCGRGQRHGRRRRCRQGQRPRRLDRGGDLREPWLWLHQLPHGRGMGRAGRALRCAAPASLGWMTLGGVRKCTPRRR